MKLKQLKIDKPIANCNNCVYLTGNHDYTIHSFYCKNKDVEPFKFIVKIVEQGTRSKPPKSFECFNESYKKKISEHTNLIVPIPDWCPLPDYKIIQGEAQ